MLNLDNGTAAALAERLRTEEIMWLTTVDPGGQPQASPVWFWWDEGSDEVLVYAQPRSWKVRNIRSNPLVAVNLNCDAGGGQVVTFEGSARIAESSPAAHEMPAYLAKYRHRIPDLGMTPEEMAAEYSTPLRITPARVRAF